MSGDSAVSDGEPVRQPGEQEADRFGFEWVEVVPANDNRLNLNSLRDLRPGWDSYGGKPITGQALRTAENLTAVPMSSGGIQLELHAGGADIEIVINDNGKVESVYWGAS